ncbi:MAG: hypothetical protein JO004_03970 [Methylobacteriaceae bacterium]|nr:hypothetical protein [Methylobacteriaceae bacterium]
MRGVAMLHSFWYSAGEQAFRAALAADPSCLIADWGIAAILMNNALGGNGATPADAVKAHAGHAMRASKALRAIDSEIADIQSLLTQKEVN